eukprot:CAMPEP_0202688132 /NCGR_PEP_ID=MMETSP1385-20130828/3663_1 /ASSEMBLY_ACC=CAM_ASM_000861 /TAXON_ID=933848 /ORGANISM="Elphidium margaritaceum" /LENGTH=641 /DNA_ID=CAMNT_0049343029 /DNA_START=123 /DNA_END=2048 /DNA_ORIENTATION=+
MPIAIATLNVNDLTERTETPTTISRSTSDDVDTLAGHHDGDWDVDRILQSVLGPHQNSTNTNTSTSTCTTQSSHTDLHKSAHNRSTDADIKTVGDDDDAKCSTVPSEYYGHHQHHHHHQHQLQLQVHHPHPPSYPSYPPPHANHSSSFHYHNYPTIAPPTAPTPTPTKLPTLLQPKHGNHAKGNFYISKEKITEIMTACQESFRTECVEEDEKLLFSYYKESVAMQINDEQLYAIPTAKGDIVIINIDLHFRSNGGHCGEIMYLIASENDYDFVERIKWKISALMTRAQIFAKYGAAVPCLPRGSRTMEWFKEGMRIVPTRIDVRNLDLHHLNKIPIKNSKRKPVASSSSSSDLVSAAAAAVDSNGGNGGGGNVKKGNSNLSLMRLRQCIRRSFRDAMRMIPAVVIKGKKQWIEWKKFVHVYEETRGGGNGGNGGGEQPELIAISLRFHTCNQQWKIACIDYDVGRVYYQHRLCSLPQHHPYTFRYEQYIASIPRTVRRRAQNLNTVPANTGRAVEREKMVDKATVANDTKTTKVSKYALNKHAVEFVPRGPRSTETQSEADQKKQKQQQQQKKEESSSSLSIDSSRPCRATTVKQALSTRGERNNMDNEIKDILNGIVFENVHDIDTFEQSIPSFGAITH